MTHVGTLVIGGVLLWAAGYLTGVVIARLWRVDERLEAIEDALVRPASQHALSAHVDALEALARAVEALPEPIGGFGVNRWCVVCSGQIAYSTRAYPTHAHDCPWIGVQTAHALVHATGEYDARTRSA